MKKIFLASVSILIFSIFSFGQDKEISLCPSDLTVTGPSGLVDSAEPIIFTSEINNPENYPVIYKWVLSSGEIIKGQGTSSITVLKSKESGETLVATLEISDLSGFCPTISSSESMITDCGGILPMLVDEISPPKSAELSQEFKDRLDNFAVTLLNDPNATGYILGKFTKNKSELPMKTMLDKIILYLTKVRNFDASRLKLATAESEDEEIIQFWIVPAGAELPTP